MKKRSVILAAALACVGILQTGCFKVDNNPAAAGNAEAQGSAQVTVNVGKVGALAKGAALAKTGGAMDIDLAALELTLTAPGEAPVTQSIPLSGHGSNTINQTFTGLASLKTWTLAARSADHAGHTIHTGTTSFEVRPKQTTNVSLNLASMVSMLKAQFFPIRDSVTRCELWVDDSRRDSASFPKQSKLGDTVRLAYDYLATGTSHTIRLDVHGEMWGIDTLLYSESTTVNVAAGVDVSRSMVLRWVGPNMPPPGQASMTVALGATGTVTVAGNLEGQACKPLDSLAYELVPREAMITPDQSSSGLRAEYNNGDVRVEGPINFGPYAAGNVPSYYPADSLADSRAPALWQTIWGLGSEVLTGYLNVAAAGTYDFDVSADDYGAMDLDGSNLILADNTGSGTARVHLAAGLHPIRLEFRNRWGSNWFRFYWKSVLDNCGETPVSPVNLALNASRSGTPSPLESDDGWGGGTNKWDMLDGNSGYTDTWAHGLAFTGGTGNWMGAACGERQATVDLGALKSISRVEVYHHGAEHYPNTYRIEVWIGSAWSPVFSTTHGHDYVREDLGYSGSGWGSSPTVNTFAPVSGSKVRFVLNNCDITHGWIYDFRVFGP